MTPAFKVWIKTFVSVDYRKLISPQISEIDSITRIQLFKIYDSHTSYVYATPQTSHSDQNHVHKESTLYNIYTNIYNHARLYFVKLELMKEYNSILIQNCHPSSGKITHQIIDELTNFQNLIVSSWHNSNIPNVKHSKRQIFKTSNVPNVRENVKHSKRQTFQTSNIPNVKYSIHQILQTKNNYTKPKPD